jgi:hypothetical protein
VRAIIALEKGDTRMAVSRSVELRHGKGCANPLTWPLCGIIADELPVLTHFDPDIVDRTSVLIHYPERQVCLPG